MVDNIGSTGDHHAVSQQASEAAAKDQLFPDSKWTKGDLHKCVGQWVNNLVQTLHNENAQMKKANEQLKKSEEGQ